MNYARKSIKNHFGAWRTLLSRIAVHASQKVVDAEIGDKDGKEGRYHVDVIKTWLAENAYRSFVEWYGIDHEGDERP